MSNSENIENFDDAAKAARSQYFIFLSFCVFCLVTTVSIRDIQLLLYNSPDTLISLPVVNIPVRISIFYIFAPIFLIAFYISFQTHLCRLKEKLDINNDEDKLKNKLFPFFLFNSLVLYSKPKNLLDWLQYSTAIFTTYHLLPLTLFIMHYWILKLHSIRFNSWTLITFLLGVLTCIYFFFIFFFNNFILRTLIFRIWIASAIYISPFLFFSFNASLNIPYTTEEISKGKYNLILTERDLRGANFSSSNLLQKANLEKASLLGANLDRANLFGANLKDANLENASLFGANLKDAKLHYTDLSKANLEKASLLGANLESAGLNLANLEDAGLDGATLQYATLQYANLENVSLSYANLENANLRHANLENANLKYAKSLTAKQLCSASILYRVRISNELKEEIEQNNPDCYKRITAQSFDVCSVPDMHYLKKTLGSRYKAWKNCPQNQNK